MGETDIVTLAEGIDRLEPSLRREAVDRYGFACSKAVVIVKLKGVRTASQFTKRDNVSFRVSDRHLFVEERGTGSVRRQFSWEELDTLVAGEPETDNGTLFQG